MNIDTQIIIVVCLMATLALVAAEFRAWTLGRTIFKMIASSTFVLIALQLNATASSYGCFILAALVLGWIGDAFLLSHKSRFFLFGIASFLFSHVVFSIAFAHQPLNTTALCAGFAIMSCIGIFFLKYLWSHLLGFYRAAVTAYVIAIMVMCSLAIAATTATGNWIFAVGALAFAASDISVARDRFVTPGFINRAWGLPLYYAAQVLLALSVTDLKALSLAA